MQLKVDAVGELIMILSFKEATRLVVGDKNTLGLFRAKLKAATKRVKARRRNEKILWGLYKPHTKQRVFHLAGSEGRTLCGASTQNMQPYIEVPLTCHKCPKIAAKEEQ